MSENEAYSKMAKLIQGRMERVRRGGDNKMKMHPMPKKDIDPASYMNYQMGARQRIIGRYKRNVEQTRKLYETSVEGASYEDRILLDGHGDNLSMERGEAVGEAGGDGAVLEGIGGTIEPEDVVNLV